MLIYVITYALASVRLTNDDAHEKTATVFFTQK